MAKKNSCEPCREIRIYNVDGELFDSVKNISSRKGISAGATALDMLTKIVDSYPDEMKVKKEKCKPCKEIRIRGVGKNLMQQIENIAFNLGVQRTSFLDIKLADAVNSMPQHLKSALPQ